MTQRLSVGSKPHPHARIVAAALLSEPAFSWGLPSDQVSTLATRRSPSSLRTTGERGGTR